MKQNIIQEAEKGDTKAVTADTHSTEREKKKLTIQALVTQRANTPKQK